MKAQTSHRYTFYFLKDIVVASVIFIFSQSVSCVLWVFKREDTSYPEIGTNVFQNFIDITIWPYTFVSGQGASEIISPLFPGQLIITGTV